MRHCYIFSIVAASIAVFSSCDDHAKIAHDASTLSCEQLKKQTLRAFARRELWYDKHYSVEELDRLTHKGAEAARVALRDFDELCPRLGRPYIECISHSRKVEDLAACAKPATKLQGGK